MLGEWPNAHVQRDGTLTTDTRIHPDTHTPPCTQPTRPVPGRLLPCYVPDFVSHDPESSVSLAPVQQGRPKSSGEGRGWQSL